MVSDTDGRTTQGPTTDGRDTARPETEPGTADGHTRTAESGGAEDIPPRSAQTAASARTGAVLREMSSAPSLLLALVCLVLGIPAAIIFTPDQHITVAGQHVSVGARPPSLSASGPAQLVQVGNTALDIAPLRVYGPLRPRLTLGPVQRNDAAAAALDPATGGQVRRAAVSTVAGAFLRWYAWAAVVLLGFTMAAVALASCVRMLLALRQQSRRHHEALTAAELWHLSRNQIRGMVVSCLVVTMLAWAAAGALAYTGAVNGLKHVSSLSDLVGRYYLTPSPVGPVVRGFTGAVIGDSRASRAGGPLVANPSDTDRACGRSRDSLAAEIGAVTGAPVANLACPGASVSNGLRGPQSQGGQLLAPQVGLLKQMTGLRFVVVMVGPNDLGWTDQLRYCYGVADCQDRLTEGEFTYRLAAFDRDYGDLLHDLNDLPDRPQVIVVTSYDLFAPDASCADAKGPPGAVGLSADTIRLLNSRNRRLNDVLAAGALKYGFEVARPVLTPLCRTSADQLGPDVQGLADPVPFHPTTVGMLRLASAAARLIHPPQ